jgi:hypothetical protein
VTHDADPDGIQRQRPSLATGTSPADKEPAIPFRPRPADDFRLKGIHLLWRLLPRRLVVLGIGLALGAAFSTWVAWGQMPSSWGFADRATTWLYVMGGPASGYAQEIGTVCVAIPLGWLGILLIPAHPCRPHPVTAGVTLLGFAMWYFAGFLAVIGAVYGA